MLFDTDLALRGADVADGVTPRLGTPRPVSIQRHFYKYHSVTNMPDMSPGLGPDENLMACLYSI